jgi:hypothetical protein
MMSMPRSRFRRVWQFLAIIGPGLVTANVDNDAGGIATYSIAGATFGYKLLWTLIPMTLALIIVQEMCARMGAVTGKGLADLIRERFGVKITFFAMIGLLFANFGTVWDQQIYLCAHRGGVSLVAGIEGNLQDRGTGLSFPVFNLFLLYPFGNHGQSTLGRSYAGTGHPTFQPG